MENIEYDVEAMMQDLYDMNVALHDIGTLITNFLETRDENLLQIALGRVDDTVFNEDAVEDPHETAEYEIDEDGSMKMTFH